MNKELLIGAGKMLAAKIFSSGKQGKIVSKSVRLRSGDDYTYQLFIPAAFDKFPNKQSERFPLVVFLHGIRERGRGGFVPDQGAAASLLVQYLSSVPAVVMLPQCAPGKYWTDSAMNEMVISALDQTIAEYDCDAQRIYLTGVSMGGYGVWHYASNYPEKFAALVSICGGSPLMNGDRFTPIAEKCCRIPAWLFHGAEDSVVPVSESRMMVKALQNCKGKTGENGTGNKSEALYSEYENVGHNVWLNALNEKNLLPWLLSHSR